MTTTRAASVPVRDGPIPIRLFHDLDRGTGLRSALERCSTRIAVTDEGHGDGFVVIDLDADAAVARAETLWNAAPDLEIVFAAHAEELERIDSAIPTDRRDQIEFLVHPVHLVEANHRLRRLGRACEDGECRSVRELGQANRQLQVAVADGPRDLTGRNTALEAQNREMERALQDLEQAQATMLQHEKLASIGQLAAGVAHELNNPIGFVHSNLGTLKRYFDRVCQLLESYRSAVRSMDSVREPLDALERKLKIDVILADLPDLIQESRDGADRVRKIVSDLRGFSRPSENEPKYTDINEGLQSTLNIVQNEIKYKASLEIETNPLPPVRCIPGQINQVILNLLMNAAQAVGESGSVHVSTRCEGDEIAIRVEDDGCGIEPERLKKIFDPFYTTKKPGEGTGLGLSISLGIVKRHGGELLVESQPGKGTSFEVRLPIEGPDAG